MSTLNISNAKTTIESGTKHRRKIPFTPLAILLVIIHFVFLLFYFEPAISTPDAQGYFTQAKLIAREGKTYLEPESILQYIGPHWLHRSDNLYFTTFSPGFPTILAVVYKIFGPKASLLVSPLMSSLSLLGLFLLCRLWIGKGWALLALSLMAVNPFANQHALFGDSHTAVVFFLIWALFFLARWVKSNSVLWAFGTGLFVGIIPTIRYPEVLFFFAIAIFVLFHLKGNKIYWRSIVAGAIGAAIPIGALCIRNQMAFGAFWRTGYGLSNEPTHFGLNYLMGYSLSYLKMLLSEGCGLMFILGIIGIAVLCARKNTWKEGVLFILLVAPITLLYMSYFWKLDPQSMRFLLPTFYVYTIAGVWLMRMVIGNRWSLAWTASAVILLITFLWGLPQSFRPLQRLKEHNAVLSKVTGVIEKHVEPGNILIANEGINQNLDFIGYWRLVDASILKFAGHKPSRKFPPNQGISPQKAFRNIETRLKYADLTGKELFNAFSSDVWRWAAKRHKVYIIANEEQILMYKAQLSKYDELVTIEKIELPEVRPDNFDMSGGFRPPRGRTQELIEPRGPMGPNRIFDILLNGKPLFLVEWTHKFL